MATLTEELAAIRLSAEGDGTKPGRIPPALLAIMHKVTNEQQASDFRTRLPGIGRLWTLMSIAPYGAFRAKYARFECDPL